MATPNSGHTHGSNTPSSMTNYQTHNTYDQGQQQYQSHDHNQYEQPGLMPADYNGKEVYTGPPPQQQQQGYYPAQQKSLPPPTYATPEEEKKILGMRKTTFLLALLSAVLLVAAIGAGAAAGVVAGQKSSSASCSNDELSASGTPSPSSDPSSSTAPPATSSSPARPTATARSFTPAAGEFNGIPLPEENAGALGVTSPNCPGTNLTETAIAGTDLVFVHECGINYWGEDLGQLPMTSMEDCLNLCAMQNVRPQSSEGECIGVAWVFRGRQGTADNFCWLKHSRGAVIYDDRVESAWLKSFSDFGR